jgi:hypothetical protein
MISSHPCSIDAGEGLRITDAHLIFQPQTGSVGVVIPFRKFQRPRFDQDGQVWFIRPFPSEFPPVFYDNNVEKAKQTSRSAGIPPTSIPA